MLKKVEVFIQKQQQPLLSDQITSLLNSLLFTTY